jgi:hypothetical protein
MQDESIRAGPTTVPDPGLTAPAAITDSDIQKNRVQKISMLVSL